MEWCDGRFLQYSGLHKCQTFDIEPVVNIAPYYRICCSQAVNLKFLEELFLYSQSSPTYGYLLRSNNIASPREREVGE